MTPDAVLAALDAFGRVLAVKLYRLAPAASLPVPTLPCLDHEAMLHEAIAPHLAAYLVTPAGDLHEVVFIPGDRRVEIDTVSTWGEHSPASRDRLVTLLKRRLPSYRLRIHGPAWWRGDRRVANACLAQVSLREVLLSQDIGAVRAGIERLQAVAGLMEKHSRVGSWGVRYQVKDVARAIDFYTQRLGFKLEAKHLPAFAEVSLGELKLILSGPGASGSRPMPDGRRQEPGGWNRVVLEVDDLPACIEALKKAGLRFRNEMETGPGGKQIQLEDPDGNPLELFQPAR